MDKISVFGSSGFVGGEFCSQFEDSVIRIPRETREPETPNILVFISTVDNYNIKTDPFLDIQTNLIVLIEILEAGRKKFGKELNVAYISSWFSYGSTDFPAREESYCNPTGFYSITKRCAEQLLISYCQTYGIKYRILRLANVLGVEDRKVSLKKNYLQHAIRQLVNGETVTLYEGALLRDFIDVRDAVQAIELILENGETDSIWNVGNGAPESVAEIIYHIQDWLGRGEVVRIPVPEFHKQVQVPDMYLDTEKLNSLGYQQQYEIYETAEEIAGLYAKG